MHVRGNRLTLVTQASRLVLNLRGALNPERQNWQSDQTTIHFELRDVVSAGSSKLRDVDGRLPSYTTYDV